MTPKCPSLYPTGERTDVALLSADLQANKRDQVLLVSDPELYCVIHFGSLIRTMVTLFQARAGDRFTWSAIRGAQRHETPSYTSSSPTLVTSVGLGVK